MVRTRRILEDLEAVRENLLALSDDIWLSIDHNDPQALDEGVEFKRSYNAKSAVFDQAASELSALVQQYTSVHLEATEQTGGDDRERNARIVAELNREEPHTLNEDFTFKRPYGLIFDGQGTTGITTWQRMYELVCGQLLARDANRFRSLVNHPDFVSNRGHHTFTTDAGSLRKALSVGDGLFVESNLSANGIRDVIRALLAAFAIPADRLLIFLRQDRDAGRGHDET
ncbi:MAG: hypothetical protein ACLP9L_09330 [Thermoguttaceae bacterium]